MEKFRIGLFGGSFDPVTKGHIHIAEQLLEQGVVDIVKFVPAYVSYHGKSYHAHPLDRLEMITGAIDCSKYNESLYVSGFEIDNKMKTCTYDFVEKYLDANHDDDIQHYFIVGSDNATKIPNFKSGPNGEKLMDIIPMIVVNRGDHNVDDIEWCNKEPHIVVDVGNKYYNCSSTSIREAIGNIDTDGLSAEFLRDWCPWYVFAYIMEAELYTEKSFRNRNWE